jgi:hypothetical protein
MAGIDWTELENDLIVADYFEMLKLDQAGLPFNKSERRRNLLSLLKDRSDGSIEFKHANISAVMKILGQDIVTGYLPRFNIQMPLVDAVIRHLDGSQMALSPTHQNHKDIQPTSRFNVSEEATLWIGPPPTHKNEPPPIKLDFMSAIAKKYDVAERDARNRTLGFAGEERVFLHERANLRAHGKDDLAKQIRWTSQEDGDGAGYDISSFEPNGKPRLIEVKTTNGWERTPFHISRNELAVADQLRDNWCLVRLWNFAREPKAFEIRPPLDAHITLTPTSFLASIQ